MAWKDKLILGIIIIIPVTLVLFSPLPELKVFQPRTFTKWPDEYKSYSSVENQGVKSSQSSLVIPHEPRRPVVEKNLPKSEEFNGETILNRVRKVKTLCHAFNRIQHPFANREEREKSLLQYNAFFVAPDYDLLVCAIPKVMSTTWKTHLVRMSHNLPDYDNLSAEDAIALSKNSKYLQPDVLKSSIKIMTTRHPFQRLASVYRDKYHNGKRIPKNSTILTDNENYRKFIEPVIKYLNLTQRLKDDKLWISFPEFIQWVIKDIKMNKVNSSVGNPYWIPQHRLCHPCHISYDVIIRAESAEAEMGWLLKYLGVRETSAELFLKESDSGKTLADVMDRYFRVISSKLFNRLTSLYFIDFSIFGYKVPRQYIPF